MGADAITWLVFTNSDCGLQAAGVMGGDVRWHAIGDADQSSECVDHDLDVLWAVAYPQLQGYWGNQARTRSPLSWELGSKVCPTKN